jgi:hypothetical protein
MAETKRSKFQRANDLLKISQLYLTGSTQAEIATQLGVSQPQICYDLKELRASWLESSLVNLDEAKARELAKIDNLEAQYWVAWGRSQKDKKTETIGGEAGATVRTEEQCGDPRFLEGVRWCVSKRCEIFGIDAPKKIGINGSLDLSIDYQARLEKARKLAREALTNAR